MHNYEICLCCNNCHDIKREDKLRVKEQYGPDARKISIA